MVKCAECGFLAVRMKLTRQLVEVEADVRKQWQVIEIPVGDRGYGHAAYDDSPLCFARKDGFADGVGPDRAARFTEIMNRERTCDGFSPWLQGLSPKEHAEMIRETK